MIHVNGKKNIVFNLNYYTINKTCHVHKTGNLVAKMIWFVDMIHGELSTRGTTCSFGGQKALAIENLQNDLLMNISCDYNM